MPKHAWKWAAVVLGIGDHALHRGTFIESNPPWPFVSERSAQALASLDLLCTRPSLQALRKAMQPLSTWCSKGPSRCVREQVTEEDSQATSWQRNARFAEICSHPPSAFARDAARWESRD